MTLNDDLTLIHQLLPKMTESLNLDENEYQTWLTTRRNQSLQQNRKFIRGSDFKEYWICPRRLSYHVHYPMVQKSRLNRNIYEAIKRHENIQEILRKHNWKTEYLTKSILLGHDYFGHLDGYSPSELILDVKNNEPSQGDLLQTGSYSLALGGKPVIVMYRSGFQFYQNLHWLAQKYAQRIAGCIFTSHVPPLHPDFPNCYYNCEYYRNCQRTCKPPKKPNHPEWNEWFNKIRVEMEGQTKL